MKLICDCFDIQHLNLYKNSGIDRILVSMPLVSIRPVRVYTKDEIKWIVNEAHMLNLEVGLNMLNFMMEEEIECFREILLFCKEINMDKIYFADMGVFQLAKEIELVSSLIYQPTTLIASSLDANHYLSLGIDKVVLSREITFEEMKEILSNCKGCEVSVFGYNPMMHSRRDLLSSYFEFSKLEDRSSSRDLYLMEENRFEKMPIFQDSSGTHVLSGSIFCFFEELKDLKNCNFKIEGRNLSEEIVLNVSKDIHRILNDEISGDQVYEYYQKQYPNLTFSKGFLYKKTSLVKEECS